MGFRLRGILFNSQKLVLKVSININNNKLKCYIFISNKLQSLKNKASDRNLLHPSSKSFAFLCTTPEWTFGIDSLKAKDSQHLWYMVIINGSIIDRQPKLDHIWAAFELHLIVQWRSEICPEIQKMSRNKKTPCHNNLENIHKWHVFI